MTTRRQHNQPALFDPPPDPGKKPAAPVARRNPHPTARQPTEHRDARESNDYDLLQSVAAVAGDCGYLLVGAAERVYRRADHGHGGEVVRVPRYEEDAVHQLLRHRWLTLGGQHNTVTCGAATLTGTSVLVPKATQGRIARWRLSQQPPRPLTTSASWAPKRGAGHR